MFYPSPVIQCTIGCFHGLFPSVCGSHQRSLVYKSTKKPVGLFNELVLLAVMLNEAEARAMRPKPEAEAEANFWRLRPRPRPKIIMKKVPNDD